MLEEFFKKLILNLFYEYLLLYWELVDGLLIYNVVKLWWRVEFIILIFKFKKRKD